MAPHHGNGWPCGSAGVALTSHEGLKREADLEQRPSELPSSLSPVPLLSHRTLRGRGWASQGSRACHRERLHRTLKRGRGASANEETLVSGVGQPTFLRPRLASLYRSEIDLSRERHAARNRQRERVLSSRRSQPTEASDPAWRRFHMPDRPTRAHRERHGPPHDLRPGTSPPAPQSEPHPPRKRPERDSRTS